MTPLSKLNTSTVCSWPPLVIVNAPASAPDSDQVIGSLLPSVARNGEPTLLPAAVFSATLRLVGWPELNAGSMLGLARVIVIV